jgi:hypothetical protein
MNIQTPTSCPFLWILPEDIFEVPNQARFASTLKAEFGCETWLLDDGRSLAISFAELLTDRGAALDIPLFETLVYPLFGRLNRWLTFDNDTLNLLLPTPHYWGQVLLPHRETEKKYCMHVTCDLSSFDSMTVQVFATRALEQKAVSQLRDFLQSWLVEYGTASIHGELLERDTVDLQRFTLAETTASYRRDGFQFVLRSYKPVTWPWLDLYLKARRTFPKRNRPSFEFSDLKR